MNCPIARKLTAALAGLAIFALASPLYAAPSITGTIEFVGGANLNGPLDTATAFSAIFGPLGTGNPLVRSGASGTYSIVPAGTEATFSLFTFNPGPVSPFTLWSFSVGSTLFSFDATSVAISDQNANFLDLEGTGVAHVTGYADTQGTWSITLTGSGPTFTFGEQTTIVPEPSTATLLLAAVGGLSVFWRANARRKELRV
jgi:hypothetical protein